MVSQLIESKKRDGEIEPTLVYTNTTAQVDEVADLLESSGCFQGTVARLERRILCRKTARCLVLSPEGPLLLQVPRQNVSRRETQVPRVFPPRRL